MGNLLKIRHKIEGNLVTFYNDAPIREGIDAGIQGYSERVLVVEFPTPPLLEDIEKAIFVLQHRSRNWTPDHKYIPCGEPDNSIQQCKVCAHFKDNPFHIVN